MANLFRLRNRHHDLSVPVTIAPLGYNLFFSNNVCDIEPLHLWRLWPRQYPFDLEVVIWSTKYTFRVFHPDGCPGSIHEILHRQQKLYITSPNQPKVRKPSYLARNLRDSSRNRSRNHPNLCRNPRLRVFLVGKPVTEFATWSIFRKSHDFSSLSTFEVMAQKAFERRTFVHH